MSMANGSFCSDLAMLIYDLEPRLTQEGSLEVPLPGFLKAFARITPWSKGFRTVEVRHRKAVDRPLWALEIFPRHTTSDLATSAHSFFSDIPTEVSDMVRSFQFGQCVMLRWLARYPEAGDLCNGNPRLFWLLTAAIYDSDISEEEIPELLRQKQTAIMGRIIKPPSSSTLRILRKVKIDTGDLTEARIIIRALKKPHIRRIVAHLEAIPVTLIKTIYDNPDLGSPSVARFLAEEIGNPEHNPVVLSRYISDTLTDIRRMSELLGIEDPEQAIARCRSMEELNRLHDRWVDRVNRDHGFWLNAGQHEWPENLEPPEWFGLRKDELEYYMGTDRAFPNPPFPDSKEIKAIRSIHELIGEGRLQRNCIASYATTIMNGGAFVYKVLSPHRATLELTRSENGWELGQLRLSCNRAPGPEVEQVVSEWMANNRQDSSCCNSAPT